MSFVPRKGMHSASSPDTVSKRPFVLTSFDKRAPLYVRAKAKDEGLTAGRWAWAVSRKNERFLIVPLRPDYADRSVALAGGLEASKDIGRRHGVGVMLEVAAPPGGIASVTRTENTILQRSKTARSFLATNVRK